MCPTWLAAELPDGNANNVKDANEDGLVCLKRIRGVGELGNGNNLENDNSVNIKDDNKKCKDEENGGGED